MSNVLKYKNYIATIEFSSEDGCLFGKIEHINDLILFDGENAQEVEQAFHEAVDNYLAFCKEQNKEPDQPFRGSFNVRVGEKLHREAAIAAKKMNISLNELVANALSRHLESSNKQEALSVALTKTFRRMEYTSTAIAASPQLHYQFTTHALGEGAHH